MLSNRAIWYWFKKEAWDFVKRHTILIGFGALLLYLLSPSLPEIRTLLLLGVLECFAIFMSGFAQWVFTKINFVQARETRILGHIFIGVHLLFGLCIFGVYFVMFIKP